MTKVSLDKLLETGAHFGHQTKRWNPKMRDYVYGVKDGIYIFDLIKTRKAMESALEFLANCAKTDKLILLLGTKKQIKETVREIGETTDTPYVYERWLGGTFTNFDQVIKSVKDLETLKEDMKAGKYRSYTKKERLLLERKIEKLERKVGGLRGVDRIPDILFVVDTKKERAAVLEAKQLGVTIVGIVDTNGDPTEIDYPMPMNDDSPHALAYAMDLVKQALSKTMQNTENKTKDKKETKKSKTKKKSKSKSK